MRFKHATNRPCLDTLRLTVSAYRQLVKDLNGGRTDSRADERAAPRIDYIIDEPLILEVGDGDDGATRFVVRPRNISAGGISVFHGGFVHFQTRCVVLLRNLAGRHVAQSGEVRHATLVKASIHELGIQFDAPIDPRDYVANIPADCILPPRPMTRPVEDD